VAVVLRLLEGDGGVRYALNLQSRPSCPLVEVVERFARHYNRRTEGHALDPADLAVRSAGKRLDQATPIGDLLEGMEEEVDLTLTRAIDDDDDDDDVEEAPATTTASSSLSFEEPARASSEALRGIEIPPANELIETKEAFDELLYGVGEEVVLALFFDRISKPAGKKLAVAYAKMSHLFWPKALLLRVDVDRTKRLVAACGVTSIPTVVFFKNRDAVDKLLGENEITLNVKLSKWLKPSDDPKKKKNKDQWGAGLIAEAKMLRKFHQPPLALEAPPPE